MRVIHSSSRSQRRARTRINGARRHTPARWPKQGERDAEFTTSSGIVVEPLYTAENLADWNPETALGYPGEYPYTRGIQPTMYRGRFWTMRQYAGFASAEESNQRYHYLLAQGTTGLSVAFDLPTQMGYDADHALAEGEVGKVGVSISQPRRHAHALRRASRSNASPPR